MPIVTSQKITTLYEKYKNIDVTFSKEIIQVTGLLTQQVYLKSGSDFWPCVVFTSSFQGAKIVANTKTGVIHKLEKANNMASLRFSFRNQDTGNPVTFFVNAKSVGTAPYGGSDDMAMIALQFTQRPPDDLIEIMGRVLDANISSAKRKDERIMITPDTLRRLNLATKESVVFIQKVPRRCILKDISFSGAKLIMVGVEKFLLDKDVSIRLDFQEPQESIIINGKFIRAESVEGRKELIALALVFDENHIPMNYKIRINDFLSQVRADTRGSEEIVTETKEDSPKPAGDKSAPADAPGAAKAAASAPENAPGTPEDVPKAGEVPAGS